MHCEYTVNVRDLLGKRGLDCGTEVGLVETGRLADAAAADLGTVVGETPDTVDAADLVEMFGVVVLA
jgi:hypothetical protein